MIKEGRVRKTYSPDFKLKAIKMVIDDCKTQKSVCMELGINIKVFERWLKKYREIGEDALKENRGIAKSPNKGGIKKVPSSLEERIEFLEAENAFLKKHRR
jgi:transposase